MKKISLFMIVLLIVLVSSCKPVGKKTNHTAGIEKEKNSIKQSQNDLLNGVSRAVCYSGFRSGQHPDRGNGAVNPTYEEILEDLKILSEKADLKLIRVYDCGENTELVLKVIRENKLDIKVLLGIWLRAEISSHETCSWLDEPITENELQLNKLQNRAEVKKGIELANQYEDIVIAVTVGNESLVNWNDHLVDKDTIITYVKEVKQNIDQIVSVADSYKWWADHGRELSKVVDFVSVHTYPIWVGKDIDEGLSNTVENLQEVRDSLPGARLVVTEAGWATTASEFGNRAGEVKQLQYYNELMDYTEKMNITTFFFEAFDEDWKGDPGNPSGAEKHWGLFYIDRKPKKAMQQFINDK